MVSGGDLSFKDRKDQCFTSSRGLSLVKVENIVRKVSWKIKSWKES